MVNKDVWGLKSVFLTWWFCVPVQVVYLGHGVLQCVFCGVRLCDAFLVTDLCFNCPGVCGNIESLTPSVLAYIFSVRFRCD